MKLKFVLSSLATALLLSGSPVTEPSHAKQPAQVSRSTWKQFTPPNAGFSVLRPGTPKPFRHTMKTQIGSVSTRGFVAVQHKGTVTYLVMYSDYPINLTQKASANQVFDSGRDVALKLAQGKLLSQRNFKLKGYPGREIVVKTKGYIVKDRMYLVNRRLYQVMVQTTEGKQKALSKSITGFLTSFKLHSQPKRNS